MPVALLFATANRGKLAEGRRLLAPAGLTVSGLADLGMDGSVEEDRDDYLGNARKKAAYWADRTRLVTLADDSGLEVPALGGEPGVRSARYGGEGLDDAGRIAHLYERLRAARVALPAAARFVCVLSLIEPRGEELVHVEGTVEGHIVAPPRGAEGFGYDPVFETPGLRRTFAELDAGEKDAWSHRGRAFRILLGWLAAGGAQRLKVASS